MTTRCSRRHAAPAGVARVVAAHDVRLSAAGLGRPNPPTSISPVRTGDPFTLKQVTKRVRDELTASPEITQVDIVSAPRCEISIEVSENDLRRHGLTFSLRRRRGTPLVARPTRRVGADGRE